MTSWHDDMMASEAAPLLDEIFGEAAIVSYTSASGTTTDDIDAILGAYHQSRENWNGQIYLEKTRTLKIKKADLAAIDLNGSFVIGGETYGIVSKPKETPTWWTLEIAQAGFMEFRSESLRGV